MKTQIIIDEVINTVAVVVLDENNIPVAAQSVSLNDSKFSEEEKQVIQNAINIFKK